MSSKPCILAIDQGTTGSTAVVFELSESKRLSVVGKATVDFPQIYPQAGWVEHDLEQIWFSVERSVIQAFEESTPKGFSFDGLQSIGITNQRETLCVFEKGSGKPIRNAIVWQCRRSTNICKELKAKGLEKKFKEKTGLVLDPYFSGSKLKWIIDNEENTAEKIHSGQALIGTIDTFLIYRLTAGRSHVTEPSNASRSLLFNIQTSKFDSELTKHFGLKNHDCLPQIIDSAGDFGKTSGVSFLPDGVGITGVLGDQQAALAGQACFNVGESKCTYGTGAFLLANTGKEKMLSSAGLLTTVAWRLEGETTYAFEGSSFIAGAAIQFIRDQLGFLQDATESEAMTEGVKASPEVYFVPALAGLGAPYWNPDARGSFLGLTRGTSKEQLVRAALEGIAFQVNDLLLAIEQDGVNINRLRIDGGAAANSVLAQFQADITQKEIIRPRFVESTALGAALFSGLGAKVFSGREDLKNAAEIERVFSPTGKVDHQTLTSGWKKSIRAIQVFSEA